MGFDDVYEVSRGAELVSDATRKLMADGRLPKPVISSACPAVVRLIRVRFPDLCDHVLNLNAPMEVSAMMAKRAASERTGIPIEEIGAFFITPCPAKVTDIKMPIGTEAPGVTAPSPSARYSLCCPTGWISWKQWSPSASRD